MSGMGRIAQALQNFMARPEGLANIIDQSTGGAGVRRDGTPKYKGWLGELTFDDNAGHRGTSTELSAETTLKNGSDLLFPLITPNQGFKDMSNLLTGGKPSAEMYDNAIKHALSRKMTGRSPFAEIGEQQTYGVAP